MESEAVRATTISLPCRGAEEFEEPSFAKCDDPAWHHNFLAREAGEGGGLRLMEIPRTEAEAVRWFETQCTHPTEFISLIEMNGELRLKCFKCERIFI